jgi:riboflavin kinase/FMN adenylyltransferase
MRIFRHYRDIPAAFRGAVVAIGNFDGVHLGHQALIAHAKRLADERGSALAVLAFEPQPQEYFHLEGESFRLTPFRVKARLIGELGADALFALAFDSTMAEKSAQDFVLDVLVEGLGAGCIVVGRDFQFGKGRSGDTTVLAYMGEMEGFSTEIFAPVVAADQGKISSTRIRNALRAGRPDEAARLLGRSWTVEGRVEHGEARGRTIGFPTANMRLDHCLNPAFGVYAVRATVLEDDIPVSTHDGVANFGIRPMYEIGKPILETYLFDFSGDLYGRHLAVSFVAWLRPELKLAGLDALKLQIERDCAAARAALAPPGVQGGS